MASRPKPDLEAQTHLHVDKRPQDLHIPLTPVTPGLASAIAPQPDPEYRVSTSTQALYLTVYFLCNISLTIYNKLILGKVCRCCFFFFAFPSMLALLP
jgi:hypothetical protein